MISEAPILSSLIAAVTHDEGLHAISIQKVREETDKDGQLAILREFITSDDGVGSLPDGLEVYNRYHHHHIYFPYSQHHSDIIDWV